MTTSTEYTVVGMTCGHCVSSVTEEVTELVGVTSVDVDLENGRLTVTGDTTPDAVRSAVEQAGYSLSAGSATT